MSQLRCLAFCIIGSAMVAESAFATPLDIPYRGVLEQNGAPFDGSTAMTFTIHDHETADSPVWTSGPMTVQVTDGLFSVTLTGVTVDTLDDAELFIGVTVGTTLLNKRQRLLAVPYARRSQDGVPPGAVMFFGSVDCPASGHCPDETDCTGTCAAACPPGWSEYGDAVGRTMVGSDTGGTVGTTVGTQLSDGGTVTHDHTVPAFNQETDEGHYASCPGVNAECPDGSNCSTDTGSPLNPGCLYNDVCLADVCVAQDPGAPNQDHAYFLAHIVPSSGTALATNGFAHQHNVTAAATATELSASAASHLPYLQLLACQKD
jgi:hypothetical protein